MKVVLLNGRAFDADVAPDELWVLYNLVKSDRVEAVIRRNHSSECFNMRVIDAERTFGDLIAQSVNDTERPPPGEMAVTT